MNRGPYKKRQREYEESVALRKQGHGLRSIANTVGMSWSTIKNWVKDIPVDPKEAHQLYTKSILATESENLKSKEAVKRYLIRTRGNRCETCGLTEWLDKPITLETEHIDGNKTNNKEDNLLLLCPNCHSYTLTWRRRKPMGTT